MQNCVFVLSKTYRSRGELQGPDVSGPAHTPGRTTRTPHRLQEGESSTRLSTHTHTHTCTGLALALTPSSSAAERE